MKKNTAIFMIGIGCGLIISYFVNSNHNTLDIIVQVGTGLALIAVGLFADKRNKKE